MNGIRVMSCVQSSYGCAFGLQEKAEKRIRITGKRMRECASPVTEQEIAVRPVSAKAVQPKKAVKASRSNLEALTTDQPEKRHIRRSSSVVFRMAFLILVFSCMLAGFCVMTRASSREKEKVWKYYTTVTVGYGEDLTDIVYQYCDSREYAGADEYVREICSINSLPYRNGEVPDLCAGTQIVIPYYSEEYK